MIMNAKKQAKALVTLMLALMLVVGIIAALPWTSVPAKAADDTGTIEVLGYTVRVGNDSYYDIITNGKKVSVDVIIRDGRKVAAGGTSGTWIPVAKLNTESFAPEAKEASIVRHPDPSVSYGKEVDFYPSTPSDPKELRDFKITFSDITYRDIGKALTFDLIYVPEPSSPASPLPVGTCTLELSQCVPYVPPESSSSSEPSSSSTIIRGTGFVLQAVNFGGTEVLAGNSFDLNATLLTTRGSYSVENVTVEVTPPKEFSIAEGSSIIYVGTVRPNTSVDVKVPLTAGAIAEEGSYTITLAIKGVSALDGTDVSASMDITIPLKQPERFEIANVMVPDFLTANMDDGSGYSSIELVNKGKSSIYNVTVSLEGEGLTSDMGSQFLGNINAGATNSADMNIIASVPGTIDATVVVDYENAKGEAKQLRHQFVIEVQDYDWGDGGGGDPFPPIDPMPEPSTGMPWWAWLLIAAGGVAAVVVVIVLVRKRKAKKAAAALEDDADEDI